ncbi:hypothetical protein COO60DRAFT_1547233, partial [Scenedesmus sp. NREL 46B-D3]
MAAALLCIRMLAPVTADRTIVYGLPVTIFISCAVIHRCMSAVCTHRLLARLQVNLHNTAIKSNSANISGGGLFADGAAAFTLSNATTVEGNTARSGGGLALADKSSVALLNSSVTANHAAVRGGGITIAAQASLGNLPMMLASVHSNTAHYGDNAAADPNNLSLISQPEVEGFVSRAVADGGFLSTTLNVTGQYGLPAEGIVVSAELGGTEPLGLSWSEASGISNMFLRIRKPPGRYHVSFTLQELRDVPAVNMSVAVRGCVPGEVAPIPDTCEPCLPGSYSLDPSLALCQPCPEGASCPGGAVILPLPGWWHSAAYSPQLHRCPNADACHSSRETLQNCASNMTCSASSEYAQLQCNTAYTGNICGACTAGFGATKPFHCRACMKPAVIITLYVLVYTFSLAESGRPQQDGQQQVASLLRCLVLYSQWILLVASLNIDWPASIAYPVQVVAWFWSTANAEALSFSCLLSNSSALPASAQGVLFYVVLPVIVLVLLLLLEALLSKLLHKRAVSAAAQSADRLASIAMVVVFFFLPSVLRTVFGLFVCIPLDSPVSPPYSAQAVGSFWVYDVGTQCFGPGWHKALSLGLGLPLMLLL